MDPFFHTGLSISDSLKTVRKSVLIYETIIHIPSERTVYRVMEEIGLNHKPKRKPNGITKAE